VSPYISRIQVAQEENKVPNKTELALRRQIAELKKSVKNEKNKNVALSLKMQSVSNKNAKLMKCVKFMQNLDLDEALSHEKENIRLRKERL